MYKYFVNLVNIYRTPRHVLFFFNAATASFLNTKNNARLQMRAGKCLFSITDQNTTSHRMHDDHNEHPENQPIICAHLAEPED